MKKLNSILIFSLVCFLVSGCISEEIDHGKANLDISHSITAEVKSFVISKSVFTEGIEGPAINSKGDLFVVNFKKEGTIGVLRKDSFEFETFIEFSNGSIGNGIRFDRKDNMFITDYVNHNILFIENGTKEVEVYCHNDSVNQPNDLALHELGFGFASDPNWNKGQGNLIKFSKGKMEIIEKGMGTTNGLALNPDGNILYVNESIQTKIWKYNVDSKGGLSNKILFIDMEGFGMDGMRCDLKGNLFLARYGKGVVSVINKNGDLINEIPLRGEKPTNVTFPFENDNELYITVQDKKWLEKIIF